MSAKPINVEDYRVLLPQLENFATADSSDVEIQAAVMSRQMDASFS